MSVLATFSQIGPFAALAVVLVLLLAALAFVTRWLLARTGGVANVAVFVVAVGLGTVVGLALVMDVMVGISAAGCAPDAYECPL